MNEALGVIEFSSIPAGYRIYNRILKDVHISVLKDLIIAPGKFIIMFSGSYGSVNHAVEWAVNACAGGILDYAIIGNISSRLKDWFKTGSSAEGITDLGVIETASVCGGIELVNRLLHGTPVELVSINYSTEMHGRCLLAFSGTISSVQAALEIAGDGELVSNVEESVLKSITRETGDFNG